MVSALDSGSRGPGSSPVRVIVLCSWARPLHSQCLFHYTHSASFHPGVLMGASKLSGKPDEMLGVTCDGLASHPGGVEITPSRFMLRKPG